jgi:hypothetical protein
MAVRRGYKLVRFRFLRALRQVRQLCPEEHRRVIEFTMTEVRHLLDHNEGAVGLEILIGNLAEVSFPTPAPLLAELRWLTERFLMCRTRALDALPLVGGVRGWCGCNLHQACAWRRRTQLCLWLR